MFIYRIEDDYGQGCYRNGCQKFNELESHDDIDNYPTPNNDKGINRYMEENEICGFKDLRQLKKWFTLKEIKRLRKNGYTIKKIEVINITAYGEKQVLAIRFPSLYETIKEEEMEFILP